MQEFLAGQTAKAAHEAIKSSLKTRAEAQQCAVLWFAEILNRKLYLELGYGSINQYAKLELGFSKSHTGEFLALCRTFKKLPKVKEKVATGELKYTSARVLATVVDEKNQDEWLDFASNKSRRELEREVKLAKQEAADKSVGQVSLLPLPDKSRPAAVVPVRVNLMMSPTQFARYERLWEQIRKQRNASADKVEAMLEIMESFVAGNSGKSSEAGDRNSQVENLDHQQEVRSTARADLPTNARPPVQIHLHQCPDCAETTVQTSKGELAIGAAELARAQCDCQISAPDKRNTTSIAPAIRRLVLARARHKCQSPGCDHTRFLEVHHMVPRSLGGTNDQANLRVLCAGCHQLLHDAKLQGVGFLAKSPAEVYEWDSGALSLPDSVRKSCGGVKGHWGVENQMHWMRLTSNLCWG